MESSISHMISWSEGTKGDVPSPLTGPSITISPLPYPHPPTIFLFGGKYVQTRRLTSEMWAMDLSTRIWERIDAGPGPGPRYFHSMDIWEDKLVCFGGMSDADPMAVHNDIWIFDCTSRRWLPPPSPTPGIEQDLSLIPSARYAHLSAISRNQLVVSGGQHADNTWVYEINVFDLRKKVWISKTTQPEAGGLHSKGAYRSVASSSKQRVIIPTTTPEIKGNRTHSYSIEEEGEGGDIWCYSNYDFAKVRRELDVIIPSEIEDTPSSNKHTSPPTFSIRDETNQMRGNSQPPGLRFPTGGIVGNHFILCGLYLASSSAAFSIWSLDLSTLTWKHLEPNVLSTGSWNRAIVWPERGKLLVFGNSKGDLATDYGKRAVNLDHMAVISLETFGIYRPPTLEIPTKIQEVGLSMLDENLTSDFDIIADDGRKIRCSRQILRERWNWFANREKEMAGKVGDVLRDNTPVLDINDTLLGGLSQARLAPTHLSIPEPFSVCVALVQYFYTLSLSTALQNQAPVLSALLFMAKQYRIERLRRLVVHALHGRLDVSNAVGIYEIASLAGEQNLQVRALTLIHSSKASGSSSRHPRQGPPGNPIHGNNPAPTGAPPAPPSGGPALEQQNQGHSHGGPAQGGPVDNGNFRRARAESVTLGDDAADAIRAKFETLALPTPTEARCESPLDRDTPVSALATPPALWDRTDPPRRDSSTTTNSVSRATGRQSIPSDSPLSERSAVFPLTPAASISTEDSFARNHDATSIPMSSASSSGSGSSRRTTPERKPSLANLVNLARIDTKAANRFYNIAPGSSGGIIHADTLQAAGLSPITPPTGSPRTTTILEDQNNTPRSRQVSSTSTILSSSQAPSLIHSHSSFGRSININTSTRNHKHFSIATTATGSTGSGSTDVSSADSKSTYSGPKTPMSSDIHLPGVYGHQQYHPMSRTSTIQSSAGASFASGSTGTSSKKMQKLEKKIQQEAEKHQKKEEARLKFEELRAQQAKKMALQKAESQKQAEIKVASKAAAAKIPASQAKAAAPPKSRFGKLGAKFSEAVLFPAGGNNSTMF